LRNMENMQIFLKKKLVPLEKYNDFYNKSHQIMDLGPRFTPLIHSTAWLAPDCTISGNVEIWKNANIWYGAVIRGDVKLVRIGSFTNIQDNTVITEAFHPIESDHDGSTIIGHYVVVGHNCHLRACTVEDGCSIGMGSILTEGSYMEKNSMLGAGSVLLSHDRVPSGELWAGNPAKKIRNLGDDEKLLIRRTAIKYFQNAVQLHGEQFIGPANFAYLELERRGFKIGRIF